MGRGVKFGVYLVAIWLLPAFMTACGGNSSSTIVSSTTPATTYAHSVAFRNNTTVVAWGYNGFGQLGSGDNNGGQQNKPVPVLENGVSLKGVTDFAIGGTHTLAFKNLSSVRAWGNNGFGQLGNGTTVVSSVPVKVIDINNAQLTGVTAVAAGGNHSLALKFDGTVWGWGYNGFGQLGDNTTNNQTRAVQVKVAGTPLTGVTAISAGGSHSLAIVTDVSGNTSVWAWGNNANGQLGRDPIATSSSTSPLQVAGITGKVIAVAAGGSHSLALVTDGLGNTSVWAWGYNHFGQLGVAPPPLSDTTSPRYVFTPHVVAGLPANVTAISAGLDHSLALTGGGVWAWGYNGYGQLGSGFPPLNTNIADPTPVSIPVQVLGIAGVVRAIRAIGHHTLATTADNRVWAWGDNLYGQLGDGLDGASNARFIPKPVSGY